jgi:hypothetical protein
VFLIIYKVKVIILKFSDQLYKALSRVDTVFTKPSRILGNFFIRKIRLPDGREWIILELYKEIQRRGYQAARRKLPLKTQWSTNIFDHEPVLHDGLRYEDHLRGENRATVKFHNVLKAGPHWIHLVNLETISTV